MDNDTNQKEPEFWICTHLVRFGVPELASRLGIVVSQRDDQAGRRVSIRNQDELREIVLVHTDHRRGSSVLCALDHCGLSSNDLTYEIPKAFCIRRGS